MQDSNQFLPPYRKMHIIVLGSITLLMYTLVLLLIPIGVAQLLSTTSKTVKSPTAQVATAGSIKKDFAEPLAMAQTGAYDTAWANSGFLLVDVRPREAYLKAHITGAMSIPLAQLQFAEFSPTTKLVLYSDDATEMSIATNTVKSKSVQEVKTVTALIEDVQKDGYAIKREQ